MPTDVAVVIVNYGTAEMAVAAADSVLARGDDGLSVEIHLVDNASPGETDRAVLQAAAARWGGAVTLHLEDVNHGFGRGNNLVLRALAARAEPPAKVYLLNPDARLVTNALAQLSAFLDAHPRAAVAGSAIIDGDEGLPAVCAFRFPGLISEFAGAVHFGPLSRLAGRWMVALAPEIPTQQVDWVAGASMMARLDALAGVGFFDPDYFLYYEEVDLMRRLKRKGLEVWHVAEAKVMHIAGAATGVSTADLDRPPLPSYWFESWRLYFSKQHGAGRARAVALARLAGTITGDLICRLRRRPSRNPRNFAADFRKRVVLPLFGLGRPGGSAHARQMPREPATATDPATPVLGTRNANPAGIGFWALVAEDFRTNDSDPFAQGFWALFWHRFGNWRMSIRPRLLRAPFTLLYRVMFKLCEWVCGIMLPYTVRVGRRVRIDHFGGMILVAEEIGSDVTIRQNTTFGIASVSSPHARPRIGDHADIGAGAAILGSVTVGRGAVVGANAVVTHDVPPYGVVVGVPARLIRMLDPAEIGDAPRPLRAPPGAAGPAQSSDAPSRAGRA